ncbi:MULTISPECIES: bactofilin family protein [Salinibaculum]|uniref:bactofilin family protein n=1 Tax=Salinibaculum TaxID=2732368 RepID=UPI0030D473E6
MFTTVGRRAVALTLVVVLLLAAVPVASAQEVRGGGAITVPAGTVHEGDLSVVGGSVLVDGTVDGSIEGLAGSIVVTGTVTGDIEAAAGSVTIQGVVEGNVEAAADTVTIANGGRVDGDVAAGAQTLAIDGIVGGNVDAGVATLRLSEATVISGNLRYGSGTTVVDDGATVLGTTERVDGISVAVPAPFVGDFDVGSVLPTGVFVTLGFVVNFLLGALLLVVAPRFARRVTETGTTDAVRTGVAGIATFVGVPVALTLTAVTIVGIPLALAGFGVYALVLWLAFVYGALVVGTYLLGLTDRTSAWGALAVGLAVPAVASFVDLGGIVGFLYLLFGLGAFTLSVLAVRRGGEGEVATEEVPPRDPDLA